MKELSIFVDESGDFGKFEAHNPYYLVSLVFHDQSVSIDDELKKLQDRLIYSPFDSQHCFHAMPLIRREGDYSNLPIDDRRKLFFTLLSFVRSCKIRYKTIIVQKDPSFTALDLTAYLSRYLVDLFLDHHDFFRAFDKIVVYYDNGQIELTKVIVSICTALFSSVEFRKVEPSSYRLFQVADLFCSLELIKLKHDLKSLSASEKTFFISDRYFKKNFLRLLDSKRL